MAENVCSRKLTDTEVKQLYHTCWMHWGAYPQIDVAIEEMAELTHALLKARRKGYPSFSSSSAVLEELADTVICLEQLLEEIGRNEKTDEYLTYKEDKLVRLESRLMESMAKKYPQEITAGDTMTEKRSSATKQGREQR